MKLNRYLLFSAFLLAAAGGMRAQQNAENFCGYRGKSPWLSWYQDHKNEIAAPRGDSDTAWLYVPVTVHIVGTNTGTGYYPTDQAIRTLCELNGQYAPFNVRFYLYAPEPFVFHSNSAWFIHDWDSGSEMINEVLPGREGRVNAFIVDDPAGNCGYSWQDVVVMAKGCSGPGNGVWAHEFGHHFSLPHTFLGWESTEWNYNDPAPLEVDNHEVEKTDGSNCAEAGDGFCDTPPDYLSFRWTCNENQESAVQHDPDGVPFRSDGTLFMSYANDGCWSRFSDEQIDAIRTNIYTEHAAYLQESEVGALIADGEAVQLASPIDSQAVEYNDFTLTWSPVTNARFYHVQVAFNQSFSILLYNKTLTDVTSVNLTSGIPNNRTLYWRVRAYNDWDFCQPDNYTVGVFKTRNFTATNELEQNISVDLSPNPVAGGTPAVLLINNEERLDARLRITDAAGRLCQEQRLRLSPGENRVEVETSGLQAGLYIVTLQNEKGSLVKRLAVAE